MLLLLLSSEPERAMVVNSGVASAAVVGCLVFGASPFSVNK